MFRNHYYCFACRQEWSDLWAHMTNDRCPHCRRETEPEAVEDLREDGPGPLFVEILHYRDDYDRWTVWAIVTLGIGDDAVMIDAKASGTCESTYERALARVNRGLVRLVARHRRGRSLPIHPFAGTPTLPPAAGDTPPRATGQMELI